jgi:hypothetical protein
VSLPYLFSCVFFVVVVFVCCFCLLFHDIFSCFALFEAQQYATSLSRYLRVSNCTFLSVETSDLTFTNVSLNNLHQNILHITTGPT